LIAKHGTLGEAIEALRAGSASAVDLSSLHTQMDELGNDLRDYVAAADVTKESLLSVISRVSELTKRGTNKAIERIKQVETLLNAGPLTRPPSAPMTLRTSNPPVDADTPLGTVSIGGNATTLTATMLFTMVHELQAKVEVLTERSKNTGVIFDRKAFSSETEFVLWFMSKNPSGEGLAGFVDIILFWAFSISNVGDASQFLIKAECLKKIGLRGKVEVAYAYSMSTRYPTAFVGNTKDQILSTTTILMFSSYEAWRGDGSGDGKKQTLTTRLAACMRGHCQYCEDNISDPELRSMALCTAEAASTFWERLVAYVDDEYSLLMSFHLLAKHVLLLLSNQVVQICDDIFEFRGNAANVDITERAAAAARFCLGHVASSKLHERLSQGQVSPPSCLEQHFRAVPHAPHGGSDRVGTQEGGGQTEE